MKPMQFKHTGKRLYQIVDPSREVVDYIRRFVPGTHKFCDENGSWHIDLKYIVSVGQIQLAEHGNISFAGIPEYEKGQLEEYVTKLIKRKSKTTLSSDAHSILHLLPNAPRLIVDAVWKALAKLHHPDRGGDMETFKKYQEAYDKITKGK